MRKPSRVHWPVFVAGLGTMVVPLDAAVNVAFPDITRAFGLSIPRIQWIVIVYMLAQTSLMLVFGRLGDMLGHGRVFVAGSVWSVLAFLACAAAPSYPWLLAGRVAQGIGAGLLLSCGPALAISGQDESARARLLGLYTMLYSAGFAIGPVLAGFLIARFGWPSVFWFRAPIALLAVAASLSLLADPPPRARQHFDTAGAILLIGGMSAAVLFVDRLQHFDEGLLWPLLALAAAGLGFWLFCRQEQRSVQPIIDIRVFKIAGFARLTLAAALVNLACFSVLLLVPFYLVRVAGLPVRLAGLVLACAAIGMTLASPLAGLLASRAGPYALARGGCLAMVVGLGGIAAAPGLALLLGALLVQGVGQGIFQVAIFDLVTATLPADARGVAGSLGMLTRTVGVVIGASVLILAFQTLLRATGGAFTPAYQGLFALAALVPAVCIVILARPARG